MDTYTWLKSLHIIAVVCWMAGLLYLPRLFVYHAQVKPGSEASEIFKAMERRLMNCIMNPAMLATMIFGTWLGIEIHAFDPHNGWWLNVKMVPAAILLAVHFMLEKYRRDFERDQNKKSHRFFRILNEVPTVLMIAIVFLVVAKPF